MAAAIVLTALLSAVLLSLRSRPRTETVPDPHEGQVYINDGFNMVWLTPHEGVPVAGMKPEDFRRDEDEDGTPGARVRYIGADYAWTFPTTREASTGTL